MKRVLLALAALSPALACGGRVGDARAQWVVTLHTDAPVPQFGDRVLVEVLEPSGDPACSGCRRLFGARTAEDWPLSFGLPDEDGAKRLLRVRLFRSDQSDAGGGPRADLVIDDVSTLPATGGGARAVDVVLSLACAGIAADVAGSRACDPATGALVPRLASELRGPGPRPGSAPEAAEVPCPRDAPAGMICVPGGLFARGSRALVSPVNRITPERLVRVSPFALDEHELTVREMRALVDAGKVAAPSVSQGKNQVCTYTPIPGDKEDYPVNCVSSALAAKACEARGLRLPTEAEWEFAAGNRTRETRFPWGDDPEICLNAVVGRGRFPIVEIPIPSEASTACRAQPSGEPLPWGPVPVGTTEGDVTDLGLRDLGGNLHEWTSDAYEDYDGPCSSGPRVLVDPRCPTSATGQKVERGGAWGSLPIDAESTMRLQVRDQEYDTTGFRCATGF